MSESTLEDLEKVYDYLMEIGAGEPVDPEPGQFVFPLWVDPACVDYWRKTFLEIEEQEFQDAWATERYLNETP